MPTSNLAIWPWLLNMVETVTPHSTVLDVGPGHGKAPVLLREYLNTPPSTIDAVEMWEPYLDAHRLDRLYDTVYLGDVAETAWSSRADGTVDAGVQLATYDLVMMVDVIEHIDKAAAFALLDRIPGRVVVCTPVDYFDNDPRGEHPPTERHVSHWDGGDWSMIGAHRPVEVCFAELGGWCVRLGPLPPA